MFVISYNDSGIRWDLSQHTQEFDAQAQLTQYQNQGGLADLQIEEKDTFSPKPLI